MRKIYKKAFKMLSAVVLSAAMVITAISPTAAQAAKKAPKLTSTRETVLMGNTHNFNIKNKVKGSTYEWTSRDTDVATVNQKNGVVTAVDKGQTVISCKITMPNDEVLTLNALVTVRKPAVRVQITNPVETVDVGDYHIFKTNVIPASSDDILTWSADNDEIAWVDHDGSVAFAKKGQVTITVTSLSGRSDSVTIQVLGDGEEADETDEQEDEEKDETEEEVKVIKTIVDEDFSVSAGAFGPRGSASVSQTTAGIGAEGGKGFLKVSGRTDTWNGTTVDVTDLVEPGCTYLVTGWVRYTTGEDVETFKITQERTSKDENKYPGISGDVQVTKGEWTKVTGIMEISPSTTASQVYFETLSLIDFYVDDVTIQQIEAELIEEEVIVVEEAESGEVVYQNDFEDGSILDPRANSERTNTNQYANGGKTSVEIKRENAWDGAGVRFSSDNGITKASLFDKTVHTQFYVMYAEGPDEIEFKLNNKMETEEDGDTILSQIPVKKGEWTLIEADCFIAKNTAGDMIFIETEGSAVTFYIDDVEIRVVK